MIRFRKAFSFHFYFYTLIDYVHKNPWEIESIEIVMQIKAGILSIVQNWMNWMGNTIHHTNISRLPPLPYAKFVDISRGTPDINFFNNHPYTFRYGLFLHRGAFTDDTALMLTFLHSVVSTAVQKISIGQGKLHFIFDPREAVKKIHHWIDTGIGEHLDETFFLDIFTRKKVSKIMITNQFNRELFEWNWFVW